MSDAGEVRSLVRQVRVGHGATRTVRSRTKAQTPHPCGYWAVSIQKDDTAATFLVHRLVAAAFIGPLGAGDEVNHKDGNKRNNRASNLEIVTRQENIDHAVNTGLIANKGEGNSQAVLTAEQVIKIRSLYTQGGYRNGGFGYKAIAKKYGLPWGTIRNIVKRRTWQHI